MQGRVAEATSLARRHSHAPHFSRSLEWLLFTALEFNADDMPSPAKSAPGSALSPQHSPERPRRGSTAGSLLLAAAALIRTFPQVLLIPHAQWLICFAGSARACTVVPVKGRPAGSSGYLSMCQ